MVQLRAFLAEVEGAAEHGLQADGREEVVAVDVDARADLARRTNVVIKMVVVGETVVEEVEEAVVVVAEEVVVVVAKNTVPFPAAFLPVRCGMQREN